MKKQRRNLTQNPLTSCPIKDPRCANFGYRPNKGISQDKTKPFTSVNEKERKQSGGRGRSRGKESDDERIENRKFVSRASGGDAVAAG